MNAVWLVVLVVSFKFLVGAGVVLWSAVSDTFIVESLVVLYV